MEVYILDSLLRRDQVVDSFESLIWTERWTELGDFELVIASTPGMRGLFIPDTKLATNNSYSVMTVESVEDATDTDGKAVLTVKGHSLETLLNDRVCAETLAPTTSDTKWTLQGTPGAICRYIFDQICRAGVLNPDDAIPFITLGVYFAPGTIPEYNTAITWEQPIDTMFNVIKAICDQYSLGFRLVRDFDTSKLFFEIYSGNDRTTTQTVLPPVVFSPNLDNLQNTTELTTVENAKNVAYVFSSQGFQMVYDDGVDPDVAGFERRVLIVNAQDLQTPANPDGSEGIPPTGADIAAYLIQSGKDALAKSRGTTIFDGELNQQVGAYQYGIDYNVGDLVEMRNIDGIITQRRVTEHIFVHDAEGERSYPTLSAGIFNGGNTWLYQGDLVWSDYDSVADAWGDLD